VSIDGGCFKDESAIFLWLVYCLLPFVATTHIQRQFVNSFSKKRRGFSLSNYQTMRTKKDYPLDTHTHDPRPRGLFANGNVLLEEEHEISLVLRMVFLYQRQGFKQTPK